MQPTPKRIGSRRELFVDDWLIARMQGAELRLHHPVPREVAIEHDRPWEGNISGYATIFADGDLVRLYYRGAHFDYGRNAVTHEVACYAESRDGIHWNKPELGLYEFQGSRGNSIVWRGPGAHNFAPFRDANPDAPPEQRYKALAGGPLTALASPDALHWKLIRDEPVITKGAFDSHNVGFWDSERGRYVAYFRDFRNGVRDIKTCTSADFIHWTDPQWLDHGDTPPEHLYTNSIQAYPRAPHLFVGFPKRFVPGRKRVAEHPHSDLSEGVFMSSRDGVRWHRWQDAFLRPGPQRDRWWERNSLIAWGLVTTKSDLPGAPDELSLYAGENYYATEGHCRLRRYTLRMDGFVSVHAPFAGGEVLTHPLTFAGRELTMNFATSAAGSVRVEICDPEARALPGFALDDCPEVYGDALDEVVRWKGGSDVARLAGRPVRLRFVLKDADLYAIQFRQE